LKTECAKLMIVLRFIVMEKYKNLSNDSDIFAFEIGLGSLTIYFPGGNAYVYTYEKCGRQLTDDLISFARFGDSLGRLINLKARKKYSEIIRYKESDLVFSMTNPRLATLNKAIASALDQHLVFPQGWPLPKASNQDLDTLFSAIKAIQDWETDNLSGITDLPKLQSEDDRMFVSCHKLFGLFYQNSEYSPALSAILTSLFSMGNQKENSRSQDERPFIRIYPNITTGSRDLHFQYLDLNDPSSVIKQSK
jgi:hypothetical protein